MLTRSVEEPDIAGVQLIRICSVQCSSSPYRGVLECYEGHMKREMAASCSEMMNTDHEPTQLEHPLRYLERKIDVAMLRITPLIGLCACNHFQRHFAICMALTDVVTGVCMYVCMSSLLFKNQF